jgi:hypothetical protein
MNSLKRGWLLTAGLFVAVALVGCYGSTEPATDVDTTSAVLHARGTTNSGPAESYFEYWPTNDPGSRATTPKRIWPGGISGPFSESVTGLTEGTKYIFRMCGNDQGQAALCAQQRSFETPAQDRVAGTGTDGSTSVEVSATSGPSGEHPNGTVRMIGSVGGQTAGFVGAVDCLAGSGSSAVIAFTGKPFIGGTVGPITTGFAKVIAAAPGAGTFDYEFVGPTPSPDCGSYDGGGSVLTGTFTVTDAEPPEPPS